MTPSLALRKARALIERGWCRWSFAEDGDGRSIDLPAPGATRFCAIGAIASVCRMSVDDVFRNVAGPSELADFNCMSDQPSVLRLFDLAISIAEKEEHP